MAKKKVFSIGTSLAEGLEQTIAAAHNYSGDLRIDVIPIKQISVDADNPRDLILDFADLYNGIADTDPQRERKIKELASLQSLSHSIREQGVINPIVVYKYREGYRLVAGERRTLAAILANKFDIQAKILPNKPSELRVSLLQWIENIERSDLSLSERLKNLEKIVNAFAEKNQISPQTVSVTDLSQLIGCAKSHAVNLKAVLNADEHLKSLIAENKIRNLEKAALIAGIKSKELRDTVILECIAGMPFKKLKVLSEQSKQSKLRPSLAEKRGRVTTNVNFGSTKNLAVAKFVLDAVLRNAALSHISPYFKNLDTTNCRSLTQTFKDLLKKIEELHTEKKEYV